MKLFDPPSRFPDFLFCLHIIIIHAAAQGATQSFKVRYKVPLGRGKAEEVNVPYVATIGPETSTTQPHVSVCVPTFRHSQTLQCQCKLEVLQSWNNPAQISQHLHQWLNLVARKRSIIELSTWTEVHLVILHIISTSIGFSGSGKGLWHGRRAGGRLVFCIRCKYVAQKANWESEHHTTRVSTNYAVWLGLRVQPQVIQEA